MADHIADAHAGLQRLRPLVERSGDAAYGKIFNDIVLSLRKAQGRETDAPARKGPPDNSPKSWQQQRDAAPQTSAGAQFEAAAKKYHRVGVRNEAVDGRSDS